MVKTIKRRNHKNKSKRKRGGFLSKILETVGVIEKGTMTQSNYNQFKKGVPGYRGPEYVIGPSGPRIRE